MLKIYNSLHGEKQPFEPLVPGKVSLYACGMTVYDYCHIGHARVMCFYDTVVRYLRWSGFDVTYVRNITDIDDKIIKRAQENDETVTALTERFITAMHEDAAFLGVGSPEHEPKATTYIEKMIALIQTLMDRGYAYQDSAGDVCFSVRKDEDYGKLSNRDLDDLRSGARIDVSQSKKDPLDFILWKQAKSGEPSWGSPWGAGRPGWHIECSTMSSDILGQPFDIHGGGIDLKFPHHENEIAQSESACDKPFCRYWMHSGHVQVNQQKMSKSLGNFTTIRALREDYRGEALRYFLISGHYRSPLGFSDEVIKQANAALARLYTALRGLDLSQSVVAGNFSQRFRVAMDDDFNTPEALAVLFDLAKEINRLKEQGDIKAASSLAGELVSLGAMLGLLSQDPDAFLQAGTELSEEEILVLIAERNAARAEKNWQRADEVRDQLYQQGVVIEDSAEGTTWRQREAD